MWKKPTTPTIGHAIPLFVLKMAWLYTKTQQKCVFVSDAANNLCVPAVVSHIDFYNMSLDNLDLMSEYQTWQDPNSHGGSVHLIIVSTKCLKWCSMLQQMQESMLHQLLHKHVARIKQKSQSSVWPNHALWRYVISSIVSQSIVISDGLSNGLSIR